MLYMLQVFQGHVTSVCSKCFIYFRTYVAIVFNLDVAYVAIVYSKCLSCFSLMLQQVVFMLQVFFWMCSCALHTCCKSMFQMFDLFSVLCCIYVTSVLCCSAGGKPRADGRGTRCAEGRGGARKLIFQC